MTELVNAAARANLERVIADEQRNTSLRLAQLRFAAAAVLTMGQLAAPSRSDPYLAPTIWGLVVFTLVSGVVLFATWRWRLAARWGAFAVPFIDVPMVSIIQAVQALQLSEPKDGVQTAVAIPLALVGLATLSLSRSVIVLTALVATASILRRLLEIGVASQGLHMTALMPMALAAVGLMVVSRMRALVLAARRRDLMGKYVLGERLGSGGMAEVFAATYSPEGGFERKVAVKRILPSQMERPDAVALFRREAEIGASLAHPNIVQVLDFGVEGDGCFIAMEFVDGWPLSRVLSLARLAGAPMPLAACVYVLEQLSTALDYLHTRTTPTGSLKALVHRDVNPPNVLISRLGEVKLNDFGVARSDVAQQLTQTGEVRGKLGYIAPEQLSGKRFDARADLWALGVTAYEVLTLTRPFDAPDEAAAVRALLDDPIPSARALRPELPDALESLVSGLLTRDPGERIGSAREVVERLGAIEVDRVEGRRTLADIVKSVSARPSAPRA